MIVSPADTLAIVVGIETNRMGWPRLHGPVADSCRFVTWLLEREVPAENITVLTAPLDENKSHNDHIKSSGVTVIEADAESITDHFLKKLPNQRSSLLLVHWGGHGLINEYSERLLMWPESSPEEQEALNLTQLLGLMRTPQYSRHHVQQFLVDTCGLRAKTRWRYKALCVDHANIESAGQDQQIYYAASDGEAAVNSLADESGFFSKAVLEALRELPDETWPPDFRKLETYVTRKFERLRAEGRTNQVPNRVWIRLRDRDQVSFSDDLTAPDITAHALGLLLLDSHEFDELHDALLGIRPPPDLLALYRKACTVVNVPEPGSSDVHALVDSLRKPVNAEPLFEFLVRLEKSVRDRGAKMGLKTWLASTAPQYGIDLAALTSRIEDAQPAYLVVRVIPDGLGRGYQVRVWEYAGDKQWLHEMSDPTWNYDEIESAVRDLVAGYEALRPQVEFLVCGEWIRTENENKTEPDNLIDAAFEDIPVTDDTTLGSMCRVVVRPFLKSRDDPRRIAAHEAAWSTVMRLDSSAAESAVLWAHDGSIDPSALGRCVCVAFAWDTHPPAAVRWRLVRQLFDAGTPIALWHRSTRASGREFLAGLFDGHPLAELPATVRRRRENYRKYSPDDHNHEGRDLVLLWDDPTRNPVPEAMRAPITVGGA